MTPGDTVSHQNLVDKIDPQRRTVQNFFQSASENVSKLILVTGSPLGKPSNTRNRINMIRFPT